MTAKNLVIWARSRWAWSVTSAWGRWKRVFCVGACTTSPAEMPSWSRFGHNLYTLAETNVEIYPIKNFAQGIAWFDTVLAEINCLTLEPQNVISHVKCSNFPLTGPTHRHPNFSLFNLRHWDIVPESSDIFPDFLRCLFIDLSQSNHLQHYSTISRPNMSVSSMILFPRATSMVKSFQ